MEKRPNAPIYVHLVLTTGCNLVCAHCYGAFGQGKVTTQPLSVWKSILKRLYDDGVLFVDVSGGEATTYPHFNELIAYLEEFGFPFYLGINGIVSHSRLDKIIKNKCLMGVKISLDGLSPESYLMIRDPEKKRRVIYDTVFATLKQLKDAGIYTEVSTLVHTGNICELVKYPAVLSSLGIKKWNLSLLLPKGRGLTNYNVLTKGVGEFGSSEEGTLREIIDEAKKYDVTTSLGDTKFKGLDRPIFECGAGWHFMTIQADLTAFPCPILPYTRFKELYGFKIDSPDKVSNVWDSEPFKMWLDQKENACPTCALRNKCGKCAIQADLYGLKSPYKEIPACYNTSADV